MMSHVAKQSAQAGKSAFNDPLLTNSSNNIDTPKSSSKDELVCLKSEQQAIVNQGAQQKHVRRQLSDTLDSVETTFAEKLAACAGLQEELKNFKASIKLQEKQEKAKLRKKVEKAKRQKEEEAKRQKEEEAKRQKEEEEAKRQKQEEEEAKRQKQEEEEKAKRQKERSKIGKEIRQNAGPKELLKTMQSELYQSVIKRMADLSPKERWQYAAILARCQDVNSDESQKCQWERLREIELDTIMLAL